MSGSSLPLPPAATRISLMKPGLATEGEPGDEYWQEVVAQTCGQEWIAEVQLNVQNGYVSLQLALGTFPCVEPHITVGYDLAFKSAASLQQFNVACRPYMNQVYIATFFEGNKKWNLANGCELRGLVNVVRGFLAIAIDGALDDATFHVTWNPI